MSKGGWFIEVDNNEPVKIGDLEMELGGDLGGQAQVQQGDLPARGNPGRGGRVDTS